ncbi:hypothetical protein EDB85DRAFT_1890850 [Lactarius pseudohatsudake]|nr:hypothetical protein EDB85DRAFT_1890850 [Lactarius pseudohatsudake]
MAWQRQTWGFYSCTPRPSRTDLLCLCVHTLSPVSLSALAAEKNDVCNMQQHAVGRLSVASFTSNYLIDQGVDTRHSHASPAFVLTFPGGCFIGAASPALCRHLFFAKRVWRRVLPLHRAVRATDVVSPAPTCSFSLRASATWSCYWQSKSPPTPGWEAASSLIIMGMGGIAWFLSVCTGRQVLHAALSPGPARGLHRDDCMRRARCHTLMLLIR